MKSKIKLPVIAVNPPESNGWWVVYDADDKDVCVCYGGDALANSLSIAAALNAYQPLIDSQ